MKDFIRIVMGTQSILWMFSAVMYMGNDNKWLWFSRACISLVCLGFYGIMKHLEKDGK
jgi:hypothetical protein